MDKAIDQYWYPTQQPWFPAEYAGEGILAGSADPHTASWVADLSGVAELLQEHQAMLQTEAHDHVSELAAHIIETHNTWLDAKKEALFPVSS